MTTEFSLFILVLLFAKHFVIDFPLQTPYQWMNKGTYGHPGGLLHSGLHALGTFWVLFLFIPLQMVLLVSIVDGVVHYHIDWWKMNLNARKGWKADTHPEFWTLLGFDQLLHSMTYISIVWCLV